LYFEFDLARAAISAFGEVGDPEPSSPPLFGFLKDLDLLILPLPFKEVGEVLIDKSSLPPIEELIESFGL